MAKYCCKVEKTELLQTVTKLNTLDDWKTFYIKNIVNNELGALYKIAPNLSKIILNNFHIHVSLFILN